MRSVGAEAQNRRCVIDKPRVGSAIIDKIHGVTKGTCFSRDHFSSPYSRETQKVKAVLAYVKTGYNVSTFPGYCLLSAVILKVS